MPIASEEAAHGGVRNVDGLAGERRVFADDARRRRRAGRDRRPRSAFLAGEEKERAALELDGVAAIEGGVGRVDQPAAGVDAEPPAPRLVARQGERQRVVLGADQDQQAFVRVAEEQADDLGVAVAPRGAVHLLAVGAEPDHVAGAVAVDLPAVEEIPLAQERIALAERDEAADEFLEGGVALA